MLRINSGSRLVLSKNSTLSIGSESRLIIEPGAEVIVHPHATIEWDRGTIELRGVKACHGAVRSLRLGHFNFRRNGQDCSTEFREHCS